MIPRYEDRNDTYGNRFLFMEDMAFLLYRFLRWMNRFMIFVLRLFKRTVTQYFIVAADGTQLPLTAYNYAVMQPATLLVIYYSRTDTKYRMIAPVTETAPSAGDVVQEIEAAYRNFEVPSYSFLGISVSVGRGSYDVPPQDFMVVGSRLFTKTFNLWLCKNYLHVTPSDDIQVTFIDDAVRVVAVTSDVTLLSDKYLVKQI